MIRIHSLQKIKIQSHFQGLLIQQFNTIATNQQYTKFENKNQEQNNISITTMPSEYKNEIIIDYEDANENTLFAKPTYTDDDTDRKFEEILQTAYNTDKLSVTDKNEEPLVSFENSLTSSSVEDSIKIYNVQTGEIVKCTPEDKLSRRYGADKNDNINIPDKNSGGTVDSGDRYSESGNSDDTNPVVDDSFKKAPVRSEIDDLLPELPSVKELAKKFVSMESLSEPVKVSLLYFYNYNTHTIIYSGSRYYRKMHDAKGWFLSSLLISL